jgi:hypothetical protein
MFPLKPNSYKFYFKEGQIVEVREEFDMMGLMKQLGMELRPKEEVK